MPVRLVSFNVLHGRSLADGQVSTGRLAEACASLGADVLCLQEIDRCQPRSGAVDQVAAVAEAMGAPHWRFEPALIGEPGGTWRAATEADTGGGDPGEAGYGVGLVSRFAVGSWWVLRLPAARVRAPVAVPGGRGRFILLPDEPRVALGAELDVPGAGAWLVATTHLSFVPGYNAWQLRTLTRAMAGAGPPVRVLAGDLNLPRPVPAWVTGWRELARARTFPADRPSLQVDHVLGSGPLPAVARVEAVTMPLSDHRALVVDLDLDRDLDPDRDRPR